jgi:hypothetical protein
MRPVDQSSRQESEKKRRLLSEVSDACCRYEVDRRRRSRGAGTAGGRVTEPQPPAPDSGHYEVASDAGGEIVADAMTLIETAKLSGLNPQLFLADVLARINDHM